MTTVSKKSLKPEFRNIHALRDVPSYRLPLAGMLSILHRISGLLMFLLLPLLVWLMQESLTSELSWDGLAFTLTVGGLLPAWLFKLVLLVLIWALLHHLFAGIRHVIMDCCHTTSKETGRWTAQWVFAASLVLTLLAALRLFGMY